MVSWFSVTPSLCPHHWFTFVVWAQFSALFFIFLDVISAKEALARSSFYPTKLRLSRRFLECFLWQPAVGWWHGINHNQDAAKWGRKGKGSVATRCFSRLWHGGCFLSCDAEARLWRGFMFNIAIETTYQDALLCGKFPENHKEK